MELPQLLRRLIPIILVLGLVPSISFGGTSLWNGNGGNLLWGTAGNWGGGVPGANDTANFTTSFTSGTTIDLGNTTRNAKNVTITSTVSFTLSNGTLSIANGDISRANTSSGNQVFAVGIVLGADAAWAIDGSGSLEISGPVSGSRNVVKNSAGTLILSGTNTYTGTTTISGGTLIAAANSALGTSGTGTTIASGASLGFQGGINYSAAETVSVTGVGANSLGAIYNVSGVNTFAGAVTMTGNTSFGSSSGTLTLSGVVSGGFQFTKVGAGTVALSNIGNSFTGNINLNAGILSVGADTHLGNSGNDLIFAGGTLNASSGFTLGANRVLNSASAAANVDVSSGTLTLGAGSQISGANNLVKSGSGILLISGNNASTFTGATIINGGTIQISAENNLGAAASDVTLNSGTLAITTGFTANSGKVFTVGAGGGTLDISSGQTLTLSSASQLSGGTGSTLTKSGAGTLVLTGNNSSTFTSGAIAVTGGVLEIAAENNLGASGNDVTLNDGNLKVTGGFTANSGKIFTIGSSGGGFSIDSGQTLTLATAGQLAGTGILTNAGLGTLVLSGDNSSSFAGGLQINSGTVRISSENNLGALGNDLGINGGALNITSGFTANAAKVFTIGSSGGTLDVDSGQTVTLGTSGQLSGSGNLTKAGTGTLLVSGNNSSSFSGNTIISAGTLSISAENNLGAAASDITMNGGTLAVTSGFTANSGKVLTLNSGGGTLDISSGQTLTFASASQLTGTGNLTKNGSGTLTLGGSSAYTGNLALNGGEIRVEASQSALDSFITTSRLNALSGSGGILTLAYNDVAAKDRIVSGGPSLPSNVRLGFDAVNNAAHSYGLGAAANDMTNFAGLVIKGGEVYVQFDQNFTGPGSSSTLDMTGGQLQLYGGSGPATVTFHGKVTLTGGIVDGGGLGGAKGTLATTGDIEVASGLSIVGTPNFMMMPDSGVTTHLYGTGSASTLFNFVKAGDGTVQVDTTLGVAALLDVQKGTLLLGAADRIVDGSAMRLAANTVFDTGGYNETLGTLTLSGSSVINLGSGSSVLHFADSSGISWSSALIVSNWTGNLLGDGSGADQLYFGAVSGALSSNQVAQIWFVNPYGFTPGYYPAEITSSGEVRPRPVPEPTTVAGVILLAAALGFRERRFLKHLGTRVLAPFRTF